MEKTMSNQNGQSVPSYCQVIKFKDSNGQVKEMIFPKALDLDRPKRPRTTFSESQLSTLESEFQRNPYLIGKERTRLAANLGLSETQVKVWFQNRRTKSKRSKTDNPSSPSSPVSDRQISDDDRPKPPQSLPSTKSDVEDSKILQKPSTVDQIGLQKTSFGNDGAFATTFPNYFSSSQPPAAFDFRPFCSVVDRPFSEFLPISQQPAVANSMQQLLAGQMNTVGASQHPSWPNVTPALWYPWANSAASCFQPATPTK